MDIIGLLDSIHKVKASLEELIEEDSFILRKIETNYLKRKTFDASDSDDPEPKSEYAQFLEKDFLFELTPSF